MTIPLRASGAAESVANDAWISEGCEKSETCCMLLMS
jgi:hypothetical protein